MDIYFFALSVVLILWVLTCWALVVVWRRQGGLQHESSTRPSDLLIGLASEKYREAREASEKLQDVADALEIGLVESAGGGVLKKNARALELLPEELGDDSVLAELVNELPRGGSVTKEINGIALQFSRLSATDERELLLVQDVTETFLMARKLKQSERLALMGQMSAQMAHQMKTPLAILAGQAQMLARRLEEEPALRGQAMDIYSEARGLAGKVNDIVRFYKTRRVEPVAVFLCNVLRAAQERLVAVDGACKVVLSCPEGLTVRTDPGVLEDLLFLIGQNSFARDVGSEVLSLEGRAEGEGFSILVGDDGCGVPEDIRAKIFDPFFGTKEDGLGLGLFLARDLVGQLGGSIELQEVDKGTDFLLKFPAHRPA